MSNAQKNRTSQPETDGSVLNGTGDLAIDTERMGKICKKLKEPDPWPKRFSQTVKERHDKIIRRANEIKEQEFVLVLWKEVRHALTNLSLARRDEFEREFLPLIQEALGGTGDNNEGASPADLPIHVAYLGAEGQPYCEAMVTLMKQADALTFTFDQLSARDPPPSRLAEINKSFEQDKVLAVATVEAGRRVAETAVDDLLADRFQEVRKSSGLTAEEENRGRLLLSRGVTTDTPTYEPLGWGNVSRDAERALRKLCFAGDTHGKDH
ncbi:uncharacterized protein PV06_05505 [Exophiala oligosperma]|uniref:Uncharacterized protein n=1 Tax=Exophiala oligosperma TaxID=215243 RepID=A0A0D2E278_9EURO|nr:uncharacterized protein PV06_05505 [Exophiala oligosperma]KIW41909.1 hypothetical protein PV06_05505 [Exophiala oligosperma]